MKSILLSIALATSGYEPQAVTVTRTCDLYGKTWIVEYKYNDRISMVPATNPLGKPHYPAEVTVKTTQGTIGQPFAGTYVEGGCFEDVPEDQVKRALALESEKYE